MVSIRGVEPVENASLVGISGIVDQGPVWLVEVSGKSGRSEVRVESRSILRGKVRGIFLAKSLDIQVI